ncbi:MAG: hypothetical protein ACODAU_07760, partial [Myxococcota bacterium]
PGPAPDAAQRVQTPAIALIVYAALGAAFQVLGLILSATGAGLEMIERQLPPEVAFGGGLAIAQNVVSLLVAGGVIYGALQMKQLRSHTLAIVGAALACIPFINPCCCLIGLPLGVWAIVVLVKPEIKAAYQG